MRGNRILSLVFAIFSFVLLSGLQSNSQELAPFACDGTLYIVVVVGNQNQLGRVNTDDWTISLIGTPLPRFNSIAINPVDRMMYATSPDTAEIFRIDANGAMQSLGFANGYVFSGNGWVSGTYMSDGRYVFNQGYPAGGVMVVAEGLENSRPEVMSTAKVRDGHFIDIAYRNEDGLIYSFDNEFQLGMATVNPYSGEVNHFGMMGQEDRGSPGIAFTADGRLIVAIPDPNATTQVNLAFYEVNIDAHSAEYGLLTELGVSDTPTGGTDMASCVL